MESVTCFHPYLDEVGFCPECKVTLMNGVETKERDAAFVGAIQSDRIGWKCVKCGASYGPGAMIPIKGFGAHGEIRGATCVECKAEMPIPLGVDTRAEKSGAKGFVEWAKDADPWRFVGDGIVMRQCWPELLALVEAAEKATHRWEEAEWPLGQSSADDAMLLALEALDARAREVMDG